jgi:hypothetical protein
MASLDSVRQKIFRAVLHAKALQSELQAYFEGNPGKLVAEPGSSPDGLHFTFQSKGPIPARFGLIIGDCFQNLRSSLDYLAWELVLAAGNVPSKQNMFPICRSPEDFKHAVDKRQRLAGVHPDAVSLIEALQPYHLGSDVEKSTLLALDELTNVNKHRRVLLTELRAAQTTAELIERDGELWFHAGPGPTPVFDGKRKFGPYPVVDGKVQMDAKLIVVMAFDEGTAQGMEVMVCLNEWIHAVLNVMLPQFEPFFV